jgi:hypothetical protein
VFAEQNVIEILGELFEWNKQFIPDCLQRSKAINQFISSKHTNPEREFQAAHQV